MGGGEWGELNRTAALKHNNKTTKKWGAVV